jgi:hypothetical protein
MGLPDIIKMPEKVMRIKSPPRKTIVLMKKSEN